jgi:hypothetical protein
VVDHPTGTFSIPARKKLQSDFALAGKSMESDEDKPDTSENGPSTYRRLLIPRCLLVSSALSSQTGFLFMRPPISVKIPKRSESAFPNKRVFHFDRFLAGRMRLERNFPFYQSLDRCVAATSRGRGKEGKGGESEDRQLKLLGSAAILY